MIEEITKTYRKARELTQEQFAEAITENLDNSVTKQSVHYWEKGETHPNRFFLVKVMMKHGDWRRDWALDCLAELEPELYAKQEAS